MRINNSAHITTWISTNGDRTWTRRSSRGGVGAQCVAHRISKNLHSVVISSMPQWLDELEKEPGGGMVRNRNDYVRRYIPAVSRRWRKPEWVGRGLLGAYSSVSTRKWCTHARSIRIWRQVNMTSSVHPGKPECSALAQRIGEGRDNEWVGTNCYDLL